MGNGEWQSAKRGAGATTLHTPAITPRTYAAAQLAPRPACPWKKAPARPE